MMIINPLRFLRGGGKGGGEIPKLVPPKSQEYKRSISVAEVIDLISEGPIYGIVDRFGKKVSGVNLLRGVYLNETPVIDADGLFNFHNVLIEFNRGDEFQPSLLNFKDVFINRPVAFKLLGKIDSLTGAQYGGGSIDRRDDRDFSKWATSSTSFSAGFPQEDPAYSYTHVINNKDVTSASVTINIESLYDTSDKGTKKGKKADGGDMGTTRPTRVQFMVSYGLVGRRETYVNKVYDVSGNSTGGYLVTLGDKSYPAWSDNGYNENNSRGGSGGHRDDGERPTYEIE